MNVVEGRRPEGNADRDGCGGDLAPVEPKFDPTAERPRDGLVDNHDQPVTGSCLRGVLGRDVELRPFGEATLRRFEAFLRAADFAQRAVQLVTVAVGASLSYRSRSSRWPRRQMARLPAPGRTGMSLPNSPRVPDRTLLPDWSPIIGQAEVARARTDSTATSPSCRSIVAPKAPARQQRGRQAVAAAARESVAVPCRGAAATARHDDVAELQMTEPVVRSAAPPPLRDSQFPHRLRPTYRWSAGRRLDCGRVRSADGRPAAGCRGRQQSRAPPGRTRRSAPRRPRRPQHQGRGPARADRDRRPVQRPRRHQGSLCPRSRQLPLGGI